MRWKALESIKRRVYSKRSDSWSFGVLLYEIFALGMVPYHLITDDRDVGRAVIAGERLPQPEACPDHLYAIMQDCWKTASKERPSMSALHTRLQEAFAQELHEEALAAEGVICLDANVVRLPPRDPSTTLFGKSLDSDSESEGSEQGNAPPPASAAGEDV